MLNYALIYSKDNCPWCDRARDFLREKNISNVAELKVGRDISPEDFRKIASTNDRKSTVPLIFYRVKPGDGWKVLGGYEDLVTHFEKP
jgi:glutaredoxin